VQEEIVQVSKSSHKLFGAIMKKQNYGQGLVVVIFLTQL